MAPALASAVRFLVRAPLLNLRATEGFHPFNRSYRFCPGVDSARVGFRSYQKKLGTRYVGTLRVYSQSSLSWQLSPGARIYLSLRFLAAGNPVRVVVSWHLFPGNARRIRDVGRAVWTEF